MALASAVPATPDVPGTAVGCTTGAGEPPTTTTWTSLATLPVPPEVAWAVALAPVLVVLVVAAVAVAAADPSDWAVAVTT